VRILVAIIVAAMAIGAAPATASQGRLAVVHFEGPTKGVWYDALEASGVRIVWYQPQFEYLVRGSDAQLARAAAGPGVRSIRPYTAADKLVGAPAGDVAVSVLTRKGGIAARYVDLRAAEARKLAADPGVVAIAPAVAPEPNDERAGQIVLDQLDSAFQPLLGSGYLDGLAQLGVGPTEGFVVDVTDTGLDTGTLPPADDDFRENGSAANPSRVAYLHNETPDTDGRDCRDHGTHVASTVAGFNAGTGPAVEDAEGFNYGLGTAPYARIGVTKLWNCPSGEFAAERSYTEIVSDVYSRGARISNNSWGSPFVPGGYDAPAREFDALVRDAQPSAPGNQQLVEVFAAGNNSTFSSIGSPGVAKNVITVGASEGVRVAGPPPPFGCLSDVQADNARDMARFSSRGTTLDGRW
jgi:hypothetical protein